MRITIFSPVQQQVLPLWLEPQLLQLEPLQGLMLLPQGQSLIPQEQSLIPQEQLLQAVCRQTCQGLHKGA